MMINDSWERLEADLKDAIALVRGNGSAVIHHEGFTARAKDLAIAEVEPIGEDHE